MAASADSVFSFMKDSGTGLLTRQLAGDFDWNIQSDDGFPIIAFNNNTKDSEVVFKYNITGTLVRWSAG